MNRKAAISAVLFLVLVLILAVGTRGFAPLIISPASLPVGGGVFVVGQQIASQQLTVNSPDFIQWSVSSGSLPPGLNLDSAAGVIAGQPQQAGAFTFTVKASDFETSPTAVAFQQYTLFVSTGVPLNLAPLTHSSAVAGTFYLSPTFQVGGGVPGYTWALQSGTNADGLMIDLNNGILSGVPQVGGILPIGVVVTDASGAQTFATFTLNVLGISTASLPNGTLGTPYSQTLAATGSVGALNWALVPGSGTLPPGLNLSAQGQIAGTPTAGGSFPFQVQVTDSTTKLTAIQSLGITITPLLTITTASLPGGIVGIGYSQTLQATGGTIPYTWSATGLPAGLTLNPSTGILSGTPTAAFASTISVTVTDAARGTATAPLILAVGAPPSVTISGLPSIGVAATQPSATVSLSGGTYPLNITGTLNLAFTPLTGGAQPYDAKFASGPANTAPFTIPAGASQSASVPVMIGTVAGTIKITTTSLQDSAGHALTPPAEIDITVSPTVPVITKVTIGTVTSGGFSISVTGRSTPRDMASALFHFSSPTNAQLASADVTVPLTSAFTSWYSSSASNAFGSTFTVTVQFTFAGPPGTTVPFTAVTVSMTNSVGTSTVFGPVSP